MGPCRLYRFCRVGLLKCFAPPAQQHEPKTRRNAWLALIHHHSTGLETFLPCLFECKRGPSCVVGKFDWLAQSHAWGLLGLKVQTRVRCELHGRRGTPRGPLPIATLMQVGGWILRMAPWLWSESLWELLGAFWEPLGASGSFLGASGTFYKLSGNLLEASGSFWELLEAFRELLGAF